MSMVFIYCCSCTCRPTDEAGGLMGYFGKALSPSSYLPVHVSRLPSMTTGNSILFSVCTNSSGWVSVVVLDNKFWIMFV